MRDAGHEPRRGGDEYALVELSGTTRYRISQIGAPVFGPRGEVALGLFLIGFRGQISAEEVPRFAERLVEVAEDLTAALRGRQPLVV